MNGFPNDGNACWFNTATQVLLHVPQLANYALSDALFEGDLYKKRINACAMASAFAALTRSYWKTPPAAADDDDDDDAEHVVVQVPVALAAFRASFSKLKKSMAGSKAQHDAHEALLAMIEHVHAALTKGPAPPPPPPALEPRAASAWAAYTKGQGYSLLVDMFAMQTREVIDGKDVYDHRWGVSLPVVDSLSSVTQGLQSIHVTHAPRVLVVHLARFDASGTKLDRFVNYTLDVQFASKKYELFAVILHSGSAKDGHYTALVQHRGKWTFANDGVCTPIGNINDVIQKDAYVMLYKCTNYDDERL